MKESNKPDWEPLSDAVLLDPVAAHDFMRGGCPVAYSELFGWSLFRHDDVTRVLADHETFSNVVSKHRSVPSGMDPPEHTAYRRVLEPYFAVDRMRDFEPICRSIARALLTPLPRGPAFDAMEAFAVPFAVRCQCAFLGWPEALVEPLSRWARRNQEATLAGDRELLSQLARQLRGYVDELLAARRHGAAGGSNDVTSSLMEVRVNGVPLTDEELTSVLRNWTVGEVGSLAAAVGIVAHDMAVRAGLQQRLRTDPGLLPAAIDELLRVTGPLVSNRRVATRDVEIGGRRIAAGERISLMWLAANRDPAVFAAPEEVRLDRDPQHNLLYGAGIHVCPGAPLARLELRVAFEELLGCSRHIELADAGPRRARYPANGWASLPLRLS
jgi:cytochrome P450